MTVRLTLESSTDAPAIAADWVMSYCRDAGLAETPSFQVMTCVVEAVNNCVEHAYRNMRGQIAIRLFCNPRWLVVQVRDRGPSVERPPVRTAPDPLQIDGRGWFIMQEWMDVAQYRRRPPVNVLTLVKCLGD